MPEFTIPLAERNDNRIDLRGQLALAVLLAIAGNGAGLPANIRMSCDTAASGGLVNAATRLAAQVLRHEWPGGPAAHPKRYQAR